MLLDKETQIKNLKESNDLLEKQKEFLQSACRKAGVEINNLKDTITKLEFDGFDPATTTVRWIMKGVDNGR